MAKNDKYIKLTVRGEPDAIKAFFNALYDHPSIIPEWTGDPSKYKDTDKWASAKAGLNVDVPEGTDDSFTVYQKSDKKGKRGAVPGYVYLLPRYGPDGQEGWKIGKTTNPYSRRKTFTVKFPFPVEFHALISTDDCGQLEADLHQLFKGKSRGSGEWFDLDDTDILAIAMMMSIDDHKYLREMSE